MLAIALALVIFNIIYGIIFGVSVNNITPETAAFNAEFHRNMLILAIVLNGAYLLMLGVMIVIKKVRKK